jgi:hypothetical protein
MIWHKDPCQRIDQSLIMNFSHLGDYKSRQAEVYEVPLPSMRDNGDMIGMSGFRMAALPKIAVAHALEC